VDNESLVPEAFEFYSIGLGQPLIISAIHGRGVDELLKEITDEMAFVGIEKQKESIRVAITGKPNVGKSSFLNCILKEERAIVDEHPGTTRDSLDTYFEKSNSAYILIDTAGIRHKKKVKEVVEYFGSARAKESIRRSDVCLVLIDAKEGLTGDDLSLLSLIQEEGKGMILVGNKWDLVEDVPKADYKEYLRRRANFLNNVPVIFTSSLSGENVLKSLGLARNVEKNSRRTIDTRSLNQILRLITKKTPPPVRKGKRPRLGYISQIGVKPPTFIIFSTMPGQIPQGYLNFVENNIRQRYNFEGVPLKIILKKKKETR
jgi:GTP-binding protein